LESYVQEELEKESIKEWEGGNARFDIILGDLGMVFTRGLCILWERVMQRIAKNMRGEWYFRIYLVLSFWNKDLIEKVRGGNPNLRAYRVT